MFTLILVLSLLLTFICLASGAESIFSPDELSEMGICLEKA